LKPPGICSTVHGGGKRPLPEARLLARGSSGARWLVFRVPILVVRLHTAKIVCSSFPRTSTTVYAGSKTLAGCGVFTSYCIVESQSPALCECHLQNLRSVGWEAGLVAIDYEDLILVRLILST